MSKRKTAQRSTVTKAKPESKRRWIILNAKTNKPLIGAGEGISDEDKAHRLSDGYLIDTLVVPLWEYEGKPDPDVPIHCETCDTEHLPDDLCREKQA